LADPATIAGKGLRGFTYAVEAEVEVVAVEVEEAVEVLVPGPN
jgi:hypothetical protein